MFEPLYGSVYLSSNRYKPRKLVVQCTQHVYYGSHDSKTEDWTRVKLSGNIPLVLKMSEWAVKPAVKRHNNNRYIRSCFGLIHAFGRTLLVAPFLQLFMIMPGMEAPWEWNTDPIYKFQDFPGYSWDWPVYAANALDKAGHNLVSNQNAEYSARPRKPRPNKLMVYDKYTGWNLRYDPPADIPFVLISFSRYHFPVGASPDHKTSEEVAAQTRADLEQLARYATKQYFESMEQGPDVGNKGYAYWLDYECGMTKNEVKQMAHDKVRVTEDEIWTLYTNTICDVVRTAKKIIVALPADRSSTAYNYREWGCSLWTLAEVLLAHGDINICWPNRMEPYRTAVIASDARSLRSEAGTESGIEYTIISLSKIEMASNFWSDQTLGNKQPTEDQQPTRILAEHFAGVLNLSRIELFITALAAFQERYAFTKPGSENRKKKRELHSAMMAILNHRVDSASPEESLFHGMARLNIENDNDDFIERLISWAPSNIVMPLLHGLDGSIFASYKLSYPDQYGVRLWHIEPKYKVVGLAKEENTVIIDDCRAIAIRWKDFPRLQYRRSYGFKKLFAEMVVRSSILWTAAAFQGVFYYLPTYFSDPASGSDFDNFGGSDDSTNPKSGNMNNASNISSAISQRSQNAVSSGGKDDLNADLLSVLMIFIVVIGYGIGFILSLFGPICVRRLFGGSTVDVSSNLVAFEGTLPKDEIERKLFGSVNNRLTWDPSASLLSCADAKKRIGRNPQWFSETSSEPNESRLQALREQFGVPPEHRIFTLVDTGRLSVITFTAERPPSVALLCGRDRGMLRAVLCSWEHKNDCLYKEAVIRMSSEVWEEAAPKGWLKLCLSKRQHVSNVKGSWSLFEADTREAELGNIEKGEGKSVLEKYWSKFE